MQPPVRSRRRSASTPRAPARPPSTTSRSTLPGIAPGTENHAHARGPNRTVLTQAAHYRGTSASGGPAGQAALAATAGRPGVLRQQPSHPNTTPDHTCPPNSRCYPEISPSTATPTPRSTTSVSSSYRHRNDQQAGATRPTGSTPAGSHVLFHFPIDFCQVSSMKDQRESLRCSKVVMC